ncbi:MAG: hypothetical protein NT062_30960 [Proteobacteria bacterium]|nr:hypothetical protein [Pseudomonadota bacterium]
MLFAASARTFGGSTLRTAVFLDRSFRAHVIRRERLVYDTRFAPPAKGATTATFAHLYAQLTGELVVGGVPMSTPALLVLDEREFDRVARGAITFRSSGAHAVIVELRVPVRALRVPIGLRHGPLTGPIAAPWEAYRAIEAAHGVATAVEELGRHVRSLLGALTSAGILGDDLAGPDHEPPRYQRLWDTLRPLYEDYATATAIKQLSVLTRLSLRQLGRDLGDLTHDFQMFGGGFRETMRVLRLRAAVLLSSAPDATVGEVARAVGYGSLDAMARAYRDGGLPAPAIVRAAVRFS